MNQALTSCLTAALALAVTVPAHAQQRIGPNRYEIVLHANPHPATPEAARRMLLRIEEAADSVCGAEPSDLGEFRRAVRRSACWRDGVAAAVMSTGDPLLAQAYRLSAKPKESA